MNIGEDNSTTSEVNEFIYTHEIDPTQKKKIRTRSYKTELGKMTRQRNGWRAAFLFAVFIIIMVLLSACTDNQRARNFGGTETIKLPPGKRLVVATWKQDNLWYLTESMPADYIPQSKEFIENSSFGVMEGKVIFIESR